MTTLHPVASDDLPMLERTCAIGFDKLSYTHDLLDGEIDPPVEMYGVGLSLDYMTAFLPRLSDDPLRRMIARGDIEMKTTPITFENRGSDIRIDDAGSIVPDDDSLLVWCLGQGVRTGVTFRIKLERGRCASLNFYSAQSFDHDRLQALLPTVFLTGHLVHKHMESRRRPLSEALLSRREVECLEGMAEGLSNCAIARRLGLSTETVKEYAQSLYRKFRVNSRAEAVARGYALTYLG